MKKENIHYTVPFGLKRCEKWQNLWKFSGVLQEQKQEKCLVDFSQYFKSN
jgi:hypothetical protein